MIKHHSDFQLIGETVTVSYIADPSVGHGHFRLENHGTTAVMAAVKSVWLEIGIHRQPLSGFTVYNLDQEQMVNPERFKIDAGSTIRLLIGFPKITYEPGFGESTGVGVRLSVNGAELQALSSIVFERRIPRNRTAR